MKMFRSSKSKKIIIIMLIILVIGFGGYSIYNRITTSASGKNLQNLSGFKVARGDIQVTISGTGTVEPISVYDITPLVKGNILEAQFKEGVTVKKGDLLYRIDDTDLLNNIEKSKNSIEKLKLNYDSTFRSIENLIISSSIEGRIENLTINTGDEIKGSNVKIADVINDKELRAVIPFNQEQIQRISIGQNAKVLISQYMTYIDGKVVYVNNIGKPSDMGTTMYNVEVAFSNPGIINEGMKVTAVIKGSDGEIESPYEGEVEYLDKKEIYSETSGTVKEIFIKDSDWVEKGEKILELENNDLVISSKKYDLDLVDLQLSLDSQLQQLEDYNILSPIDGTVVEKNYKAGDTINSANSSTILMTVADMTKMIFTIDVDELDIAKLEVGQQVNVTADALSDQKFIGEVTNVPVIGKSQNGVTTYPVEVTISEPGQLKPGMNVNAEILVTNKENVLYVPIAAVSKVGGRNVVFVDASQAQQEKSDNTKTNQENKTRGINRDSIMAGKMPREVVLGANNDDYIEIISGLEEGETIYMTTTSSNENTNRNFNSLNKMGGGMGFPTGGGRSRQ